MWNLPFFPTLSECLWYNTPPVVPQWSTWGLTHPWVGGSEGEAAEAVDIYLWDSAQALSTWLCVPVLQWCQTIPVGSFRMRRPREGIYVPSPLGSPVPGTPEHPSSLRLLSDKKETSCSLSTEKLQIQRMSLSGFCGTAPLSEERGGRTDMAGLTQHRGPRNCRTWSERIWLGGSCCVDPAGRTEDPFLPGPAHSAFPERKRLGVSGRWFWNPETSSPKACRRRERGIAAVSPRRQIHLIPGTQVWEQCPARNDGTADFDWNFLVTPPPSTFVTTKMSFGAQTSVNVSRWQSHPGRVLLV